MDKNAIKTHLLSLEADELRVTQDAYRSYVSNARVDASQTFDDQDLSLAAQARNLAEAFECSLHDQDVMVARLKGMDFGPKIKIEEGAVIKLDGRYFVIGIATDRFTCDGVEMMGISPRAPIYSELAGLEAGDRFSFSGQEHYISEVL